MLRAARRRPPTVPPPPPGDLRSLYVWLDRLPLSRPKRHLARHFGDGVMMAKIVKYFHPQLVDLHNYVPTCNTDQKLSNWSTFNRKVFHKLCFCISEADICKVVANMPGAMEPILCALRAKVEEGALGGSPASKAPSLLFPHPSVSLAGLQMAFALQSGHGWLALGGPRPWGPAAAGGQGAGSGHLAGDSEDFADEGGPIGAAGEAEGPEDPRAGRTCR